MVAGKSSPSSLARAAGAPKLPPLPKLRVRKPDRADANPCIGMMSSVLGKLGTGSLYIRRDGDIVGGG